MDVESQIEIDGGVMTHGKGIVPAELHAAIQSLRVSGELEAAGLGFDMTQLVLLLRTILEAFTYDKDNLLSRSRNHGQRPGVQPSQSRLRTYRLESEPRKM